MTSTASDSVEDGAVVADLPSVDVPGWNELGPLLEAITRANATLKAAAREVNRRYDLGPRGAWIVSRIYGGVRLPTDLAATFHTSRSLMAIELNRVIKAGLAEAGPSPVDRRRTELRLTPLGLVACREVRMETANLFRRNLAAYSAEEIQLVIRVLTDARRLGPNEDQLLSAIE